MGYYPQRAFVSRLAPEAADHDKESYVTFSGFLNAGLPTAAIPINIQPASAEFTALHEGTQGKMFQGFTSCSGVVEGFLLTLSGTDERYVVRGRSPFFYGQGQHAELVLVKADR